jgi:anti-sigma factor RsiW
MSGTAQKKRYTDAELMLYVDGELPPEDAKGVAAYLAENAEARLKLESLRQVGEAVRTYAELETDRAEVEVPAFADMWSRIERRIHANGIAGPVPAEARAKPAAARRGQPVAGLWAAMRRWFEDHRGHVLTSAISAGAACALMLALGPSWHALDGRGDRASTHTINGKLVSQPPEVEDLEVYEGSGTILTLEPDSSDDSAATVIWISNDDMDSEGPI